MDRYWNFVAMPFFIVTLLFGIYVLFTVDEQQFASPEQAKAAIDQIQVDLKRKVL
jgi:hypothetical protein